MRNRFLLISVIVLFFAGATHADHDIQTYTFEFTGSSTGWPSDTHDFTIYQDGALYFKLKSVVTDGSHDQIVIGFVPTTNPSTCWLRYASTITNPTIGQTYGPYYVEKGTYQSYYSLFYANTTSYALDIEYRRQLTPNDVEPNDSMTTAQDIGDIVPNSHITGHLGYLGCEHNIRDHIRFGILSSGNYRVNIDFDSTFDDRPNCEVYFHLYDEAAMTWLDASYVGPPDTSLGPIAFQTGGNYIATMELSSGCYDGININGAWNIVDNKAGAYDIQIYDPSVPIPVTLRLKSVTAVQKFLNKKPNQKYLNVVVENFGTTTQAGYIEISVVDNNLNNQPVFSDDLNIHVQQSKTDTYEIYADTSHWPTTQLKATASLYSAGKTQFLGSRHAIFNCVDHRGLPQGIPLLMDK